MLDKIRNTIARFDMLKKGDRVLVGVSGGPDSMALLHILNGLKRELGLKLFVAHLNHMLRGKDAVKDADFVKKAVKALGLPIILESKDVPAFAGERGLSVEEAARELRYDFYARTCREFKTNKIALGHTGDDQAETVLMRLIRGSGLLGLAGIPPKRRLDARIIVRPLIETSKKDILGFLRGRNIKFRTDSTNLKAAYLRNRIRLKLIPLLEKEFNPEIKNALQAASKNLRIDYDYLKKAAGKKFKKYAGHKGAQLKLSLGFLSEDVSVQRMLIREAIKNIKGDLAAVTYSHWEKLNDLLKKKKRWAFQLPGKIEIRRAGNFLVFSGPASGTKETRENVLRELKCPGETVIPGTRKTIKADFVKLKRGFNFRNKASKKEGYFDFEKLALPLCVRFKEPKDRIIPFGMDTNKRLKQIFIDEKVPFEKRGRVPLVVSGDRIIWVCGIKRSADALITAGTGRVLRLIIH